MKDYFANMVVSSRVRLARNVNELDFPPVADLPKKLMSFINAANVIVKKQGRFKAYAIGSLTQLQKQSLIEKHLISPLLSSNNDNGAVLISNDEKVSVMLNEEDHLRIQCVTKGFDLVSAFLQANDIDNKLAEKLPIAYDEKLGFLTACPSNLGTGMRASVMMFLPALTKTEGFRKIVRELNKVKIEVRGIYGEGSKASASLYQISNKLSLGYSEFNIISAVMRAAATLADAEAIAREQLIEDDFAGIKDKAMRAYGIIMYAHKLKMSELYECYENIKLGQYYDFFTIKSNEKFDDILWQCAQANLLLSAKTENEEILRAREARRIIADLCTVN